MYKVYKEDIKSIGNISAVSLVAGSIFIIIAIYLQLWLINVYTKNFLIVLFGMSGTMLFLAGILGIIKTSKRLSALNLLSRYGYLEKDLKYTIEKINDKKCYILVEYKLNNGKSVTLKRKVDNTEEIYNNEGIDLLINKGVPSNYYLDFKIKERYNSKDNNEEGINISNFNKIEKLVYFIVFLSIIVPTLIFLLRINFELEFSNFIAIGAYSIIVITAILFIKKIMNNMKLNNSPSKSINSLKYNLKLNKRNKELNKNNLVYKVDKSNYWKKIDIGNSVVFVGILMIITSFVLGDSLKLDAQHSILLIAAVLIVSAFNFQLKDEIKKIKWLERNGQFIKNLKYDLIPSKYKNNIIKYVIIAKHILDNGEEITLGNTKEVTSKDNLDGKSLDLLIDPENPLNYHLQFNIRCEEA